MSIFKSTIAGHFTLRATNVETGEQRLLAEFDNLITNAGLNRLGTGGVRTHCMVGSGSTPPANTDTALQTLVASTTTTLQDDANRGASSSSPYYSYSARTYRFGMGVAAGNLSEVGVGWAPTSLFSRALIKDPLGDPTTVTVFANEFLDVTYETRVYAPAADVTGTLSVDGVSTDYVLRAAYVTDYNYWPLEILDMGFAFGINGGNSHSSVWDGTLGAITAGPSGSPISTGIAETTDTYVNNSNGATGYVYLGLDGGNHAGGIDVLLCLSRLGTFKVSFDPPIAKDNTKTAKLNVTAAWARHA